MSLTATLVNTLQTVKSVTGLGMSSASVTYSTAHSHTLNGGTTPPATKHASKTVALSDGAATIDLAALTGWGVDGANEDMSGLKLQILRLKATAGNANPITITAGASNGYEAFGAAWSVELKAGQECTFYGNDATPDVAGTDKTLDLAGTGSQSIDVELIFG